MLVQPPDNPVSFRSETVVFATSGDQVGPHRANDACIPCEQHSRCDMDGFIREILIAHRRLTRGKKGKVTIGSRQCNDVNFVACKVDLVSALHEGKHFLDCSKRRLHEGDSC